MNVGWKVMALVLLLSCLGAAADALLKLASSEPNPFLNRWFALGMLCTTLFAVAWLLLMQTMKLSTAGVVCAVTSALLLVGIGVVCFGERLSGAESVGVLMALGAVILLGRLAA